MGNNPLTCKNFDCLPDTPNIICFNDDQFNDTLSTTVSRHPSKTIVKNSFLDSSKSDIMPNSCKIYTLNELNDVIYKNKPKERKLYLRYLEEPNYKKLLFLKGNNYLIALTDKKIYVFNKLLPDKFLKFVSMQSRVKSYLNNRKQGKVNDCIIKIVPPNFDPDLVKYNKIDSFANPEFFSWLFYSNLFENGDVFYGRTSKYNNRKINNFSVYSYSLLDVKQYIKPDDLGIFYNKSKGETYKGFFDNGVFNRYGIYKFNNEIEYEGEWYNSYFNGYGILSFPDKSVIEGEFVNGALNGFGYNKLKSGAEYYGYYKFNLLNGFGYFKSKDNSKSYIGEFKDNKMNGFGEFSWKDKKYIGNYSDDKKSGFGIHYWQSTESIYFGYWENGYQNGEGCLIFKNNNMMIGQWAQGELVMRINIEELKSTSIVSFFKSF